MEELRAGNPLTAGDVTLVPIERSGIQSDIGDMGYWLTVFKEPFAVVVCDATGTHAFDTDSAEIAVDALIQKIPNLGTILSDF